MTAEIGDFSPLYLQRITQLTNKSNQFNLTTKRYTAEQMEAVYNSDEYIRLYGKLYDKFGDNGVVAVTIGKTDSEDKGRLDIELWLMSCRVLKRDMELAMLDSLVKQAKKRGIREIYGHYYPTAKNKMVAGLYESFGFEKISQDEDGNTAWRLLVEGYEDKNTVIKVKEIIERLDDVFRDVFDDDTLEVDENTTADDIEDWDSIEHITLIGAVEDEFKMRFKMGEVSGMKDVGEMIGIIEQRGK